MFSQTWVERRQELRARSDITRMVTYGSSALTPNTLVERKFGEPAACCEWCWISLAAKLNFSLAANLKVNLEWKRRAFVGHQFILRWAHTMRRLAFAWKFR